MILYDMSYKMNSICCWQKSTVKSQKSSNQVPMLLFWVHTVINVMPSVEYYATNSIYVIISEFINPTIKSNFYLCLWPGRKCCFAVTIILPLTTVANCVGTFALCLPGRNRINRRVDFCCFSLSQRILSFPSPKVLLIDQHTHTHTHLSLIHI